MSINTRVAATGFLIGAAIGLGIAASRRAGTTQPRLLNWDQVRRIAVATSREPEGGLEAWSRSVANNEAGTHPSYDSSIYSNHNGAATEEYTTDVEELSRHYGEMVKQSTELIVQYTGHNLPTDTERVFVFGRRAWIDANIVNFKQIFEPFDKIYQNLLTATPVAVRAFSGLSELFLSSQVGLLLGYMSQRVLGQYDNALLGREPITTGRVYFVEPNIRRLQKRLNVNPEEFRLWIALHETTHAYEFEAHPWVRDYMNSLIERYFESISNDITRLQSMDTLWDTILKRFGSSMFDMRYIIELIMTPEQKRIFYEIQALMSLLEGYSNHIMQVVGEKLLPSYHWMKERFDERNKNRGPADRLFAKLTGLDIKMEQYILGEKFVNEIVSRRGIDFMSQVWTSRQYLPTLDEIRNPQLWIERMDLRQSLPA